MKFKIDSVCLAYNKFDCRQTVWFKDSIDVDTEPLEQKWPEYAVHVKEVTSYIAEQIMKQTIENPTRDAIHDYWFGSPDCFNKLLTGEATRFFAGKVCDPEVLRLYGENIEGMCINHQYIEVIYHGWTYVFDCDHARHSWLEGDVPYKHMPRLLKEKLEQMPHKELAMKRKLKGSYGFSWYV